MSLARSLNRAVSKATYDPELEKQLAAERARAREARGKFRETIDKAMTNDRDLIRDGKLTPQGATQSAAYFKLTNDWLQSNPDASADEILDKSQEFLDKLSAIYREDSNRLYFYNNLKISDIFLTQIKTRNIIPEDKYKKLKELLDKEQTWLEKNPNESAQTYQDRITKMNAEAEKIIGDPDIAKKLAENQKTAKEVDNTKELEAEKQKADEIAKKKEELEKEKFSFQRFFKKITTGIFSSFWIALLLTGALLGGALAANEAVVRPLPYRIFYFLYGFFFFPIVILFFIGRYFMGQPPYFSAFLFPLYEYDPVKVTNLSFLQKLVYYKTNAVLQNARKTFEDAQQATKSMGIDFVKVAKEILEEKK